MRKPWVCAKAKIQRGGVVIWTTFYRPDRNWHAAIILQCRMLMSRRSING
jgi:hypothetical protein